MYLLARKENKIYFFCKPINTIKMTEKKKDGPFMSGVKLGFKTVTAIGKAGKYVYNSVSFVASLKKAVSLPEPDRTEVVHEVYMEWKKHPDFNTAEALISALNKISEPTRRRDLLNMLSFCTSHNKFWSVRAIHKIL